MKQSKLDAFKAKANSILLADAMLHVTGGVQTNDPDYCHCVIDKPMPPGKKEQNYTQCQVDSFFANPYYVQQFNSMYAANDVGLANQRAQFFDNMVQQG